ncbi:DUF4296 domain-containing protein [Polaribacter sp.]|uniref:DUF4296 domain-containing protein n=1 Tax=Polaribacter sp. TaxID=1920175 RepID=UPI0025EB9F54|nr:DUF4296 domain-containing protein [Polaribacter sp.]
MKKLSYLLAFLILGSCTSNTIFEKPTDLISKDTMSLLVQEMMIASSATYIKNKNMERNMNYMPLVYERFQIDSVRFQTSNLYYISKIDEYKLIFEDAKNSLKKQKAYFDNIKNTKDSLRLDSIKRNKELKKDLDSVRKAIKLIDSIPKKIKN